VVAAFLSLLDRCLIGDRLSETFEEPFVDSEASRNVEWRQRPVWAVHRDGSHFYISRLVDISIYDYLATLLEGRHLPSRNLLARDNRGWKTFRSRLGCRVGCDAYVEPIRHLGCTPILLFDCSDCQGTAIGWWIVGT
jgi:hypothetical protein